MWKRERARNLKREGQRENNREPTTAKIAKVEVTNRITKSIKKKEKHKKRKRNCEHVFGKYERSQRQKEGGLKAETQARRRLLCARIKQW